MLLTRKNGMSPQPVRVCAVLPEFPWPGWIGERF